MSLTTEESVTTMTINGEADLLRIRSMLRAEAQLAGLSLTAETKLVTAGSELARNIVRYATHGQGSASVERLRGDGRRGVRAAFSDSGPGIAPEIRGRLFQPFAAAGKAGDVGLVSSRQAVIDHGGEMWVE